MWHELSGRTVFAQLIEQTKRTAFRNSRAEE